MLAIKCYFIFLLVFLDLSVRTTEHFYVQENLIIVFLLFPSGQNN